MHEEECQPSLGLLDEDSNGIHSMNTAPEDRAAATNGPSPPTSINPEKYVLIESYMDSGAARSVCPLTHGQQFGIVPTQASIEKKGFRTATGREVLNRGGRNIMGITGDGKKTSMMYAVADQCCPGLRLTDV